jgi:hypothetical protein
MSRAFNLSTEKSRVVWKHELPAIYDEPFQLELPTGARVLSVQMQYRRELRRLVLWEVHEAFDMPKLEVRRFLVTGTGILFAHHGEILIHRATVHLDSDSLVFHVFEIES